MQAFAAKLVSIHAPRGGRDILLALYSRVLHNVSIHAPRGGRDTSPSQTFTEPMTFQSTRPAGGATADFGSDGVARSVSIHAPRGGRDLPKPCRIVTLGSFQSTRPAGGATRYGDTSDDVIELFQSTRPAGGATCCFCTRTPIRLRFQSTRPAGGATRYEDLHGRLNIVSIHAPRGGRDCQRN
jgi:hypothetical protein